MKSFNLFKAISLLSQKGNDIIYEPLLGGYNEDVIRKIRYSIFYIK